MNFATFSLMGSIFTLSLLGSWHCGAMCGGISVTVTHGQTARLFGYHFGRLISYSSLGALSGLFGESILKNSTSLTGPWFIAAVLFGSLLAFGLLMNLLTLIGITSPKVTVQKVFEPWTKALFFWAYQKPFSSLLFGLLTVFLPCGWLYGFLLASASSGSPWAGALTMALFWLGGLPMMTVVPLYFKFSIHKAPKKLQPILQTGVFLSALLSWIGFYLT